MSVLFPPKFVKVSICDLIELIYTKTDIVEPEPTLWDILQYISWAQVEWNQVWFGVTINRRQLITAAPFQDMATQGLITS